MRKKIIIIPCIIAVVLLCSVLSVRYIKTTKFNSDFVYNGYNSEFVCDDERYVFTKNLSPKIISKNQSIDFDIEMFSENTKRPMYSDGMNVYFLTDNNGIYYYDQYFNIHCLISDKKTHNDSFFNDLFSNNNFVETHEDYLNSATQFVVSGRYVYLYCPGGVLRYDLITHLKSTIYEERTGETSFSYSNNKIYFQDEVYNLYYYDTVENELIKLDIQPYSFCVNNRGILFSDLENNMCLSFYDFVSQGIYVINQKEITAYDLDKEAIYYSIGGEYYQSDFTGKNQKLLGKDDNCTIMKKGIDCIYIIYDSDGDVVIKSIYF